MALAELLNLRSWIFCFTAEWAIDAEPAPASFEKAALLKPVIIHLISLQAQPGFKCLCKDHTKRIINKTKI